MKIGVTGSDHICDRIQKTLEKRMPDLEVVYRRSCLLYTSDAADE